MTERASLANEQFCYLTTTGRVSGLPREIEIWFGYGSDATIYMLSGGRDRSNWVRNLMKEPEVSVRIADQVFDGTARVVDESSDEDQLARKLLVEKYEPIEGRSLANWGKTALPVAVELEV